MLFIFALDNIDLSFDKNAIDLIVEHALHDKLGARGLRSICESIMLDAMFEMPSKKSKKKLIITKKYVLKHLSDTNHKKLKEAS